MAAARPIRTMPMAIRPAKPGSALRPEKITYTYDADNELTGAADAYATLTFTYDSGGNEITAATSGPGTGQPSVTLTSGYNAQHSLTSVTDNSRGMLGSRPTRTTPVSG